MLAPPLSDPKPLPEKVIQTKVGKLRCKETIRIDGRLKGELRCDQTVIVGESACLKASRLLRYCPISA